MFTKLIQAIKNLFKRFVAKIKGQAQAKVDQATAKVNEVVAQPTDASKP